MAQVSLDTTFGIQNWITNAPVATWGITVIDDELFVGAYGGSNTAIYVYDCNTKALKRTLTTAAFAYAIGTDGTNLLVADSGGKIVTLNKLTGATVSTKSYTTTLSYYAGSFYVDLSNNWLIVPNYGSNKVDVYNYTTGTIISTSSGTPTNAIGTCFIVSENDIFILASSYSSYKVSISPNLNTGLPATIPFTTIYTYTGTPYLVACARYNDTLFFSTYGSAIRYGKLIGIVTNNYSTADAYAAKLKFQTTNRAGISGISVVDSSTTATDIIIDSPMTSYGAFDNGTVFKAPLNKRGKSFEVI